MKSAAAALQALARAASPVPEGADLAALHAQLVGEVLAAVASAIARGRDLPTDGVAALFAGPIARSLDEGRRASALADVRAEAAALALDPHAPERLGGAYEATTATALARDEEGRVTVVLTDRRRRGGCHYTAPGLAARIVEVALAPLVEAGADALALRVVDPAMGSGACLLAALRWLSRRAPADHRGARATIAAVIEGLDVDPTAARVAAASLWLEVGDRDLDPRRATPGLRVADGLTDEGARGADAFVGNPPWVSYVGRAAQPLDPVTRARFGASFAAFAGYKNLQGLFLERAASLLRPGGRLALLVPSSMAEQQGYAPTRRALDAHCVVDAELVDVGEDAFEGVFQPCMIIAATRRAPPVVRAAASSATWPVERPDLDAGDRALLDRLAALPPLPPERFGERGVQTSGDDVADMAPVRDARRSMPLRAGGDIEAFVLRPASRFADPSGFPPRFRAGAWGEVAALVRQTAAWPIAVRSDGLPFRNSLLAAFAGGGWSPDLLVAWLNSSPVRWHHFMRFRDARQGMPQVKVSHLRAVPAPLPGAALGAVEAIGAALSQRNTGIDETTQQALDEAVAAALGIDAADCARIAAWRYAPRRCRPRSVSPWS